MIAWLHHRNFGTVKHEDRVYPSCPMTTGYLELTDSKQRLVVYIVPIDTIDCYSLKS